MAETAIHWLFDRGHAADIILAVLFVEALILRTRCWDWKPIFALLGTAALIVLGLRAALTGAQWYWVALPLALSFPLHVLDIRARKAEAAKADHTAPGNQPV
ncbi:MAG: hypothetical protein AAGK17_01315 [Pseudomonadota bacterium]